jgi:hypothetical protein
MQKPEIKIEDTGDDPHSIKNSVQTSGSNGATAPTWRSTQQSTTPHSVIGYSAYMASNSAIDNSPCHQAELQRLHGVQLSNRQLPMPPLDSIPKSLEHYTTLRRLSRRRMSVPALYRPSIVGPSAARPCKKGAEYFERQPARALASIQSDC